MTLLSGEAAINCGWTVAEHHVHGKWQYRKPTLIVKTASLSGHEAVIRTIYAFTTFPLTRYATPLFPSYGAQTERAEQRHKSQLPLHTRPCFSP